MLKVNPKNEWTPEQVVTNMSYAARNRNMPASFMQEAQEARNRGDRQTIARLAEQVGMGFAKPAKDPTARLGSPGNPFPGNHVHMGVDGVARQAPGPGQAPAGYDQISADYYRDNFGPGHPMASLPPSGGGAAPGSGAPWHGAPNPGSGATQPSFGGGGGSYYNPAPATGGAASSGYAPGQSYYTPPPSSYSPYTSAPQGDVLGGSGMGMARSPDEGGIGSLGTDVFTMLRNMGVI